VIAPKDRVRGARGESAHRDRQIVTTVCRWFRESARQLPWRVLRPAGSEERTPTPSLREGERDPYRSLVSEFMLQQTQVARVLEKFAPFMERFPTVGALAAAREDQVLAAWSGLGYYRRARHLHSAAREIVARFGGHVPETVDELRTLPGVGRYTAGAVASIVYGRAEPIVDGNMARVLMRVDGKELDPVEGMRWAWGRAGELVAEGSKARGVRVGALNEGLMELGAVVCVPRGARCGECPLARPCRARRDGRVEEIPAAKRRVERRKLFCAAVVVEDGRGRVLVERRGEDGMWAGMWQAPTLEAPARIGKGAVESWIGIRGLRSVDRFAHGTTHREFEFEVWCGDGIPRLGGDGRAWRTRAQVRRLAISNAQSRVLFGVQAALK
jgi:A/G-specific adenine glycosylase